MAREEVGKGKMQGGQRVWKAMKKQIGIKGSLLADALYANTLIRSLSANKKVNPTTTLEPPSGLPRNQTSSY